MAQDMKFYDYLSFIEHSLDGLHPAEHYVHVRPAVLEPVERSLAQTHAYSLSRPAASPGSLSEQDGLRRLYNAGFGTYLDAPVIIGTTVMHLTHKETPSPLDSIILYQGSYTKTPGPSDATRVAETATDWAVAGMLENGVVFATLSVMKADTRVTPVITWHPQEKPGYAKNLYPDNVRKIADTLDEFLAINGIPRDSSAIRMLPHFVMLATHAYQHTHS